jgi:hypothetical protein
VGLPITLVTVRAVAFGSASDKNRLSGRCLLPGKLPRWEKIIGGGEIYRCRLNLNLEENVSMFPVIGLLAAPMLLNSDPQQELTLQQVLKANTAAINGIRSIHVTIEVSNNSGLPGEEEPPPQAKPTLTIEWYKDGARERVRQNWLRGRGMANLDASNGPKGYKALHRYNPNIDPPPSESYGGHAGGELDKTRTDNALGGYARAMSYMNNFPGVTLEEYVTKYPSSRLAVMPANSKLGCYEIITLQEKAQGPGSSPDVKDVRIFVDPKVGFWVRRIEKGPWQKSTNQGDKGLNVVEVEEFKDCGNGIFWPLRGSSKTRLPGRTIGLDVFVRHTLHSINQPLPDADFEVRFPDWLIVNDRTTGQVFIWGPDDKPRLTFGSQAEFNEWDRPRVEAQAQIGGVSQRIRWMWLAGMSLLVGLMLGFIIWRRSKSAHRLNTGPGSSEGISPPSEPERR